jgi:hypothetical protein
MSALAATPARPLLAWRGEQLQQIAAAFERACRAWEAAWGLAHTHAVSCRSPAAADMEKHWGGLAGGLQGDAWIHVPSDLREQVGRELFGLAPVVSPIASEVLDACIASLRAHLVEVLHGCAGANLPAPDAQALDAWSGWVCLQLHAGAMLLVDGCSARALAAPAPTPAAPVAGLLAALAGTCLELRVQLQDFELELGTLQDLQLGDVVRLGHALDAPATVTGPGAKALFSGLLVRTGDRKAVELIADATVEPA